MKKLKMACVVVAVATVLAGCGRAEGVLPTPGLTLPPPTPAGMEELPPELVPAPEDTDDECDLTASLRPSRISRSRRRRREHQGPRHGSSSGSTSAATCSASATRSPGRSPDSTSTSQARWRATSSAPRRRSSTASSRRPTGSTALQNNQVDIVVKTMSITCERKKLVNFSTVYLVANQRILAPRDSTISQAGDLSGQAGLRGQGHDVAAADPGDQPVADRHRGRHMGRLPRRAAAASGRRGQHRRLHPRRAGRPGPVSAHRRAEHERGAVRHRRQPEEHRAGPVRQRHAGSDPPRRHVEHVVPQVVDGARPAARTPCSEVLGLMSTASRSQKILRAPVLSRRASRNSTWTPCRRCGRWRRRPSSGRSSTTRTACRSAPPTPSPRIRRR